jgi:hypothetical protein
MAQFQVFIEYLSESRIGGNVRTGVKIGGKEIWDVSGEYDGDLSLLYMISTSTYTTNDDFLVQPCV